MTTMSRNLLSLVRKIDIWMDYHLLLWISLISMTVLRIPNFFEPYWYGDEGIYLTIGTALKNGGILYKTIVDHKTPLIYYLAMVPNLLTFRLLLLLWSAASIVAFYFLLLKLFKGRLTRMCSMLGFVILTTVPWFEGHIANGEQFVMGFVMLGLFGVSQTSFFEHFLKRTPYLGTFSRDGVFFFGSGLLFGLAILTKVPALFDATVVAALLWFFAIGQLSATKLQSKAIFSTLLPLLKLAVVFALGLLIPLILSIAYFVSRGAGSDYLQFGLLYNFHYAGNWGLPFQNPILVNLFTLPGKFGVVLAVMLGLSALHFFKRITPVQLFITTWFFIALFASLLSNRPYPHYFLQVVPPLILVSASLFSSIFSLRIKKLSFITAVTLGTSLLSVGFFIAVIFLLKVGFYASGKYYYHFYQLSTRQITFDQYRDTFNYLLKDNYEVSPVIKMAGDKNLFIWGTNPMLYALSETVPVGKFTVAFHIKDLGAYDETLASVQAQPPEFIVIMNEDADTFPALTSWVAQHYIPNHTYQHFKLWKRTSL